MASFFASTDPTTNTGILVKRRSCRTQALFIKWDAQNAFNESWGTESRYHKILTKNIDDRQSSRGLLKPSELIKFH